jgi:glycosidase
MQWDGSANASFTRGKPWLHLHPDYPLRNTQNQAENPASLLNFYRQLTQLRRASPALQKGSLTLLENLPADVLAYTREDTSERILIVLNFSNLLKTVDLPALGELAWELIFNGNEALNSQVANQQIHLPGYGVAILRTTRT